MIIIKSTIECYSNFVNYFIIRIINRYKLVGGRVKQVGEQHREQGWEEWEWWGQGQRDGVVGAVRG
jgi:hypothetical protein